MNKEFKKFLIISFAVFGTVLPVIFALAANLEVQFEKTPLFSETNFLPGENVSRWVRVTNNSGESQRIATEAINKNDPDRLGDVLNLEIKEGGVRLYNDALSKFFTAGEVFLSDLAPANSTQYDFIVTFYSGSGDPFQGKSLGFDLLVGFQGTEGGILPGAGGGGGGYLPAGLTIQNESVRITNIDENSVTITWLTSYFSTSQVIYAKEGENHTLDLTDNSGTPPKYGYAQTTPEYDLSPKVTFHLVIITGLDPGIKYYYRTVSHGSLAISQEYSFTTLGGKEIGEIREEEILPLGEESKLPTPPGQVEKPPIEEKKEEEEPAFADSTSVAGVTSAKETATSDKEKGLSLAGRLLAAVGAFSFNLKTILVIFGLILIGIIILFLITKKRLKN